uniref:Aspartate-semialdehyde dehydrogenase n=1 Tax=Candidatus Actinomarina minuta TaxID=1389454 RepID=S5DJI3_9ACTN|nr:aspartate-semialdehyde dehydrogenase [Candidatus Actinomarina minuta]
MKIAVVGATGLVGRKIINLCEEYFPKDTSYTFFASQKSEGTELEINKNKLIVKRLSTRNISEFDIALFSAGGDNSRKFANDFIKRGAYVIDNSSAFRHFNHVPLIVYGINEGTINSDTKLIANPNCTTMGLVMALKPLHDEFNLKSITPVAYQAVSGSGTRAVDSLRSEIYEFRETYFYSRPIAKNVIPVAGRLLDNGYSDEEMKFVNESRKILSIDDLIVEPSNARVGVETGHGTFCSAVFENEVTRDSAIDAINNFDGIEYWDDPLPTPLDAEGRDEVLVSRMREGLSSKKILNFWVVSDNLLKGAALNAVQIAKCVSEL